MFPIKLEKWGKMSWGKMTFGEKCRSQGYYGKKWGKMFFGEKCRREKCRGEKRLWGKLSCTRINSFHVQTVKICRILKKSKKKEKEQ